ISPREEFLTKGLEGAPSNDIGWHFGTPVPNTKGNVLCKLCGKVVKGGITRFKEHIAHKTGNVAPCPNVTEGRSSHGSTREYHRERTGKSIPSESEFTLRRAIPELVRSKSSKQPKVNDSFLKSFRRKIAHCLDLCLEDIGKKPSVAKVLDEAKKVTCFIYNHIWTVDLMKKYTQGKQILQPALTRFATHFIQLEEITRQKQGYFLNPQFQFGVEHSENVLIETL
ncbi:hypothetical protein Gotur_034826, partial [Gossypium turneri]